MHLYVSFRLVVSNGGLPNSMVYLEQHGGQTLVDHRKMYSGQAVVGKTEIHSSMKYDDLLLNN